jgi:hypothetical protein
MHTLTGAPPLHTMGDSDTFAPQNRLIIGEVGTYEMEVG